MVVLVLYVLLFYAYIYRSKEDPTQFQIHELAAYFNDEQIHMFASHPLQHNINFIHAASYSFLYLLATYYMTCITRC